ncbi:trehalose-phosphatase [Iamia majanohamensis]|uniref:Trehalose 6-phosphate phosphatase n=1 Tax=Iamia majanohamensis TaxID=467976 RepID=A0AAF0BWI5_9ACTN|nr:trehalose-phosphatase [Iamia majanohamensis]WCO68078.1 trehalose-phosphatase [Iamia majanohamensis]
MPVGPDDALAVLRQDPATTGIFTDFDGTLAEIVDDPSAATPVPGATDVLGALARHHAVVAVISGRPVSFLARHLPSSVLAVGLYGLEVRRAGRVEVEPEAERWRAVVDDAARTCEAEGRAGLTVEPKGLSLTLHFRQHPELADEVASLARRVGARTGLVVGAARRSVELHPPVAADKGTALHGLAEGLGAACFLGDDRGDLTAFRALDELAAEGTRTIRVAVASDEAPAELLAAADLTVAGPSAAVDLLRTLLPTGS